MRSLMSIKHHLFPTTTHKGWRWSDGLLCKRWNTVYSKPLMSALVTILNVMQVPNQLRAMFQGCVAPQCTYSKKEPVFRSLSLTQGKSWFCVFFRTSLQHIVKWFKLPHLEHFLPSVGQYDRWRCIMLHLVQRVVLLLCDDSGACDSYDSEILCFHLHMFSC